MFLSSPNSLLPPSLFSLQYTLNGRAVVEATLSAASRRGATLLRTWAFSVAAGARLLLSPDGVYDAHLLEGLDFILHAASEHNRARLRCCFRLYVSSFSHFLAFHQSA